MSRAMPTTSRSWRIGSDELQVRREEGGLALTLPDGLGHGCSRIIQLDPDLHCIETRYRPSRDLAVFSRIENDEPRMVVTLGLKGCSAFAGANGQELTFSEGCTTITTFTSSAGERRYQAAKPVAQLRFSLGRNWLERYFGEERAASLLAGSAVRTLRHRPTSFEAILTAEQLLNEAGSGEPGRLRKHARALSILAAELDRLGSEPRREQRGFGKREMSQANSARDILQREFRKPPSVEELARRVGVNQFKLKRLFHHYFDNTPYGVLLEMRMTQAYRLLASTHCPVSVAAAYVGYSHASNFSAAFTRSFRVPPKRIGGK